MRTPTRIVLIQSEMINGELTIWVRHFFNQSEYTLPKTEVDILFIGAWIVQKETFDSPQSSNRTPLGDFKQVSEEF